jgi:hypothetical protein
VGLRRDGQVDVERLHRILNRQQRRGALTVPPRRPVQV